MKNDLPLVKKANFFIWACGTRKDIAESGYRQTKGRNDLPSADQSNYLWVKWMTNMMPPLTKFC